MGETVATEFDTSKCDLGASRLAPASSPDPIVMPAVDQSMVIEGPTERIPCPQCERNHRDIFARISLCSRSVSTNRVHVK